MSEDGVVTSEVRVRAVPRSDGYPPFSYYYIKNLECKLEPQEPNFWIRIHPEAAGGHNLGIYGMDLLPRKVIFLTAEFQLKKLLCLLNMC